MTQAPTGLSVDVHSLRTFGRLAHSGAEYAAGALSQMTGLATHVDVTRVELSTGANVRREFRASDRVSVRIGFDGGFTGQTVVSFDRESADRIVGTMLPDPLPDEEAAAAGITELGNIMIGGFIDGWADYLETTIDISTPTYVSDADADDGTAVLDVADADGESMLVFRNQLEAADDAVNFTLYMIPTAESTSRIVEESGADDDPLPLDSLAEFDAMIADGAAQASEDITAMTGIGTVVEVSRLSFVPLEDVPMQVADEPRTGVVLEFDGLPSGYIAILLDEASADHLAAELLPGMADASDEMRQSAIQEIGNIVTSGFLDGWANALETTIDISPPTFVHDLGRSVVAPLASELARQQEHAFLIDSTIRTDGDEFTCDIYALPDEAELRTSLGRLTAPS